MLEINTIREEHEAIKKAMTKRNGSYDAIIDELIANDEMRRNTQVELDNAQAEMNKLSKEIGDLFKSGQSDKANEVKQQTADIKSSIQILKDQSQEIENRQRELLYQIPNRPHDSVPLGNSDQENEKVYDSGQEIKPNGGEAHWDLAAKYDIIDFELGVKITGAGFPVYKGKGARLQRALINFFLDEAEKAGYREMLPPLMVNEDSGIGTGQLPDKEGQMYHVTNDNLYLIPTAEVPLTNVYRDVIVNKNDFPIKICGFTPCFRREAGSYGKDVRGLNRLHQFDKVEIVQIQDPEKSYETLDTMVAHVKGLLEKLNLPFRIVRLCGGDLGFAAALTFDMEVYSAAQDKWLEVSSISNFETFQANRLKLRFKDSDGKNKLAHTLNGSALALPRILAALLENNQTENGVVIPEVLRKYTGFDIID